MIKTVVKEEIEVGKGLEAEVVTGLEVVVETEIATGTGTETAIGVAPVGTQKTTPWRKIFRVRTEAIGRG